jgi:hypothetical protein
MSGAWQGQASPRVLAKHRRAVAFPAASNHVNCFLLHFQVASLFSPQILSSQLSPNPLFPTTLLRHILKPTVSFREQCASAI